MSSSTSSCVLKSKIPYGSAYFGPFSGNFGGSGGYRVGSDSLVLDGEKGELVKAPARTAAAVKKGVPEARALAALKSHSEAERRRRERINSHLSTLRGLVSCAEKMDKATLLAEVIERVKELKKIAAEASKGTLTPTDADEVRVEPLDNGPENGPFSLRATLCCDYRPELMSDLRQAFDSLNLKTAKAEISTLGDRVKSVFVFTSNSKAVNTSNAVSIHQALSAVLDKGYALPEYSPRTTLPNKRRRVSFFDSSSSSS